MSETRMIHHLFPIRPGTEVIFELPADLTTEDARRIVNFVRSLAIDSGPEPPADISGIPMETVRAKRR